MGRGLDQQRFREIAASWRERRDVARLAADIECAPGLFRWCLPPDVRRELALFYRDEGREPSARWFGSEPQLTPQTGACWVVFANRGGASLLREAFVLPLLWRPGEMDRRVPASLTALADAIRRQLGDELPELRNSDWGLQLAPLDGLDGLDLGWLAVHPESGCAALAAGLIAAVRGGRPDVRVWATGVWDQAGGHWHVDPETLPAKVRLASEFGVQRLFVPRRSVPLAEQLAEAAGGSIQVMALTDTPGAARAEDNRLEVAVRPYLYTMMPKPTADDPWQVRCSYFLEAFHERRDRQPAARFYIECLVDELVAQRRAWLAKHEALHDWSPTHSVTIYSQSFELVHLGTRLFRPQRCLLIHTENLRDAAWELAAELNSGGLRCEPKSVCDRPSVVAEIEQAMHDFLADADPSRVLIDLTPGKRLMSFALQNAAPIGSRLLCWWHDTAPQYRRVIPGSEYPLLWQLAPDRRLEPLVGEEVGG